MGSDSRKRDGSSVRPKLLVTAACHKGNMAATYLWMIGTI